MLSNPRLRLGVALWLAAMTGVVVVTLTVIPQLLADLPQTIPLELAMTASLVQSAVLVALATWTGVALSARLNLGAPVFEALATGSSPWPALARQLPPAAIVGVFVGSLLVFLTRVAPEELRALGQTIALPLAAKLLYGGVTEEVLMRWGLLTALIWLPWRLIQKGSGQPHARHVVCAIVVVGVLFGVLHLPAAAAMGASLTPAVIVYIVLGNTVPGILFGVLYWRYGLESAILAHALAHAIATAVGG